MKESNSESKDNGASETPVFGEAFHTELQTEEIVGFINTFTKAQRRLRAIRKGIAENPNSPFIKGLTYEENRHAQECALIEDELRKRGVDVSKYLLQ